MLWPGLAEALGSFAFTAAHHAPCRGLAPGPAQHPWGKGVHPLVHPLKSGCDLSKEPVADVSLLKTPPSELSFLTGEGVPLPRAGVTSGAVTALRVCKL